MASSREMSSSEDLWLSAGNSMVELTTISEEVEAPSPRDSVQLEHEKRTKNEGPSLKRRRLSVACTYCGRGFTEKKSLYRHQRTSSHCKPGNIIRDSYPCGGCSKVFARADVLQRHEREHHHFSGRRARWSVEREVPDATHIEDSDAALYQETQTHNELDGDLNDTTISIDLDDNEQPQFSPQKFPGCIVDPESPAEPAGRSLFVVNPDLAQATVSLESSEPPTSLPLRSRSSLERLGASPGYAATNNFPPCPACRKPFETDRLSLLAHIRSHVQLWQSELVCDVCEIGFQCRENLDFHLISAENRGNCGLIGFEHACTGHHPPNESRNALEFTNHEHLMMCSFLRHWEQAQLDALIVGIDELTMREEDANMRRWSWSRCRALPSTRRSSSVAPPSFRSEPKYVNGKPWTTIRLIEQKLANLSSIGPSALIRRRAAENASTLRTNSLSNALYRAIEEGNVTGVEQLLDIGADANMVRPSQLYPLQISFLTNNRYPGKHIVHTHSQKISPFALATILGRLQIAELLANNGGNDPLSSNGHLGNIDLAGLAMVFEPAGIAPKILQRYGEDFQRPSKPRSKRSDLDRLDSSSAKAFFEFLAAPESSSLSVRKLAKHLISINYSLGLQAVLDLAISRNMIRDEDLTSLLEFALSQSSLESVLVLVLYGALCDAETIASLVSSVREIVSRLLVQNFHKRAKHILDRLKDSFPDWYWAAALSSLLAKAIEDTNINMITLLVEDYGIRRWTWPSASESEISQQGQSSLLRKHEALGPPLFFAAYKGKREVVKLFLASGASVTETGGMYGSALCNAVIAGDHQIVQAMLNAGADPNQPCNGNENPLFNAIRCSRLDIATGLVQRGADPHKDVPGYGTAFIIAVRRDDFAMCKYLLRTGNNINFPSTQYGTALCAALSRSPESCEYLPMVEFLLANGADPTIGGSLGNAIEVAVLVRKRYNGVQAMEVDMAIDLVKKAASRQS